MRGSLLPVALVLAPAALGGCASEDDEAASRMAERFYAGVAAAGCKPQRGEQPYACEVES